MEYSIKPDAEHMIVTHCELVFMTPNGKHMYSIFGDGVRPDDYLVWSVGVRHKRYQEEIEKFLKENDCVDTTFKCHRFYMTDSDSEKGTNNCYPFIMNAVTGQHGSIYQPSLFTILTAYLGSDVNDWIVFAEKVKSGEPFEGTVYFLHDTIVEGETEYAYDESRWRNDYHLQFLPYDMNSTFSDPMPTHIYRNSKATVRPYYNEQLLEKKKKMEEKKNG